MKKMKKVLAGLLAATMVMSMSVTAWADQDLTDYLDKEPVVSKTYEVNAGTAPAETFTYTFEGISYKDHDGNTKTTTIPSIDDVTIDFDAISESTEKTVNVDIDVDEYELGVYTYKVTEVIPETKTTGVTYSKESLYLVLTILRDETNGQHYVAAMHYESAMDGSKETGFTNNYDAGKLTVGKEITGNMADMTKKFEFTVTFAAPTGAQINNKDESAIVIDMTDYDVSEDGLTYTFELGDGETVEFSNIPAGTIYTVTEDAENYTSDNGVWSNTADKKIIVADAEDTVTFTNTLTNEVDTGIILDSAPYILLLALAAVGMFAVVNKKREEEF